MNKHDSYLEVKADTHHDLGVQIGRAFAGPVRSFIAEQDELDSATTAFLKACHDETKQRFPQYAEEIEGYAKGAGVSHEAMWQMMLEGDMDFIDKCTTFVTNRGRLVAHNEDWGRNAADRLFVLKRTLKDQTTLELHYAGTLGGNSVSINSHGRVQAVNSLFSAGLNDKDPAVPQNIHARLLSDSADPAADLQLLEQTPRMGGYSHNLISTKGDGQNFSVEACHSQMKASAIKSFPYAHANHFMHGALERLNDADYIRNNGSHKRFAAAAGNVRPHMSVQDAMALMDDRSNGPRHSLMNERTIGRIVVDADKKESHIWLAREKDKGWLTYDLNFL